MSRLTIVPTLALLTASLSAVETSDLSQRLSALEQEVQALRERLPTAAPESAETAFTLGGYGLVAGSVQPGTATHAATHGVTAQFNPIFTFAWREDLLWVGEVNAELNDTGGTDVALGQAYMAWTRLPNAVVEAGLFPLPFAAYSERLSPAWINSMGDNHPAPYTESYGLFVGDMTDAGLQFRGVAHIDRMKITAHVFAVAGPSYNGLEIDQATGNLTSSDERLVFGSNLGQTRTTPTIGGRLGVLPCPEVEIGFSAMSGGINHPDTYLLADGTVVDPGDRRSFTAVAGDGEWHHGGFTLRGELIGLGLDAADGHRQNSRAGYGQASQRFTFLDGWASGIELAVRAGRVVREAKLGDYEADTVDVTDWGGAANYYWTSMVRTSLAANIHNAHDLDTYTLSTTFAF